jgi:hypothetical protein
MEKEIDIRRFCPCESGLEYYESKSSFKEAWMDCQRGDWMLWIACKLGVDDRVLTKAKALCANTVRYLMKDKRSTDAIDAALLYAEGKISRAELDAYANAVYEAYEAARASSAASYAASAASYAAYAAARAYDAAYAASAAAAAYADDAAAADDDDDAAYAAARAAVSQQAADLCREILTHEVMKKYTMKKIIKKYKDMKRSKKRVANATTSELRTLILKRAKERFPETRIDKVCVWYDMFFKSYRCGLYVSNNLAYGYGKSISECCNSLIESIEIVLATDFNNAIIYELQ